MSSDEKEAPAVSETFTCDNCGETFDKTWSDAEAAAEAQELFPGIDISNPDEAGVVCDDCFEHIMGRVRAEAPELIGPGWRGEAQAVSDDPIGDALRADAEVARAEIRAVGLACPSCGTNMADLPDGHMLAIAGSEEAGQPQIAECRDGPPAKLAAISSPMSDAEYATWQAAMNILVWDSFRQREVESFRAIAGDGPGDFTGLLSILQGARDPLPGQQDSM